MPLEAPRLDRSYQEILELTRSRIPRYTREWTDFNESDPGTTLIELFSWLTEQIHYQMNRLPRHNYIKFLQLLNLELRAPLPATAHLTFTAEPGAASKPVRQGTQVGGQNPDTGELVIFETDRGLDLIPHPLEQIQVYDGTGFTIVTAANGVEGQLFHPLGSNPQEGSALYLGFGPPDPLPLKGVRTFPQQMRFRAFLPGTTAAGGAERCSDVLRPPGPDVRLVWEYRHRESPERWRPLSLTDETAAFTRQGYMVVEGPLETAATLEGRVKDKPLFWLRCRLERGVYPVGAAPKIYLLRPNTVSATALTSVKDELIGVSEGHPDQSFDLRHKPVDVDSLVLFVDVAGTHEAWTRVEDFYASSPDDPHFTLSPTAGRLQFGDGRHGRIPVAGAEIVAERYRHGGGAKGNLDRGLISIPLTTLTGVKAVTNEQPSVGGKDEQAIEDLEREAPQVLRHRNRAVSAEDFTALAELAGGVSRAIALPLKHPDFPEAEVPGAVSVAILPEKGGTPPRPTTDLKRHVCEHLNRYRLLTTEVFVIEPTFMSITVQTRVAAAPYAAFGTVEFEVKRALDRFLDPMTWPFGRDLYPTSLYGELLKLELVAEVLDLALLVNGLPHDDLRAAVRLTPEGLFYGADHRVTVVEREDR